MYSCRQPGAKAPTKIPDHNAGLKPLSSTSFNWERDAHYQTGKKRAVSRGLGRAAHLKESGRNHSGRGTGNCLGGDFESEIVPRIVVTNIAHEISHEFVVVGQFAAFHLCAQ
jgi:hypothetical protein